MPKPAVFGATTADFPPPPFPFAGGLDDFFVKAATGGTTTGDALGDFEVLAAAVLVVGPPAISFLVDAAGVAAAEEVDDVVVVG